jgi:hypothetical protein
MERKEEMDGKFDVVKQLPLLNGGYIVLKCGDRMGPVVDLPLSRLEMSEITNYDDGVDFKIILNEKGPIARIPLIQIHMGKLQFLKKKIHPETLEMLVLASDPDFMMRLIFENYSNKLIDALENGAANRLNERHMTRAVRINSHTAASILAMYGCPASEEAKKTCKR